jgi:N-methylhydantoinase B/oxoprolinase/acetone carboxylase alpha subunit
MHEAVPALYDYAEDWLRSEICELPDGEWEASDVIEDDGVVDASYRINVKVVIRDSDVIIDFTGTDGQAKGPINAPYTVTFAAACNGFFQLFREFPLNTGTYRPLRVIAPTGTIVNVSHPAPCVAGQTEIQPRIIDLIQGACLGQVIPERVAAAGGGTCSNFLLGGTDPETGSYYTHYHFDGMGWGGRYESDGNSACNAPHSNCPNTPIEVFETRFPFRHVQYRLRTDSGGAGRCRGGLGVVREFEVMADEVTVSALYERMKVAPWGISGGEPGARTELLIRQAGSDEFRPFGEVFDTASPSKFTNVLIRRGDRVMIKTSGGGGYGPPHERSREAVLRDVAEEWVTEEASRQYER